MGKFKEDDVICIKSKTDQQYENRGFYKIIKCYEDGYDLFSFRHQQIYTLEILKTRLADAQADFEFLIRTGRNMEYYTNNHMGVHKNVLDMIDNSYRLATEAELTLYAK